MRSEKDLHTAFSAWLKCNGYIFFHSRMDQRTSQVCGDPDYVVCKGNRAAFIEMKCGKGRTSPAQNARFLQMARAGCDVHIARSLEDAVTHIEQEFGPQRTGGASGAPAVASGEDLDGEECVCGETNSRNCPLHGPQFTKPSSKLYLHNSTIGKVVLRHPGREFVRLAEDKDALLPVWTEAVGG